jgi:hypothetical protein
MKGFIPTSCARVPRILIMALAMALNFMRVYMWLQGPSQSIPCAPSVVDQLHACLIDHLVDQLHACLHVVAGASACDWPQPNIHLMP